MVIDSWPPEIANNAPRPCTDILRREYTAVFKCPASEVYQECYQESRGGKVGYHLSNLFIGQHVRERFLFHDDRTFDEMIKVQKANPRPVNIYRERFFLKKPEATFVSSSDKAR